MSRKIILASTSPRRKALLEKTGLVFETVSSDYEEDMALALPPKELAIHLSFRKAKAVAEKYPDAVIIAADTFVVFQGRVLGKPHTPHKAQAMLRMLSGSVHSVITGFTILEGPEGRRHSDATQTNVYLKKLTDTEIDAYVASGEPLDKAGAYAIQGLGGELIEKIEGDYLSMVGLPVPAVMEVLKKFGVF